jgi:hypothetical protein
MNRFHCRAVATSSPLKTPAITSRGFPRQNMKQRNGRQQWEALDPGRDVGRPDDVRPHRRHDRGHVREFNPSRKDPHWGRRKLKRDE